MTQQGNDYRGLFEVTCQDLDYQDFCSQVYPFAPTCEEIDKNSIPASLFSLNNNLEPGLVLQMFELGRLFLEKKMVKFHTQGTCMYPCIRPHDILYLEPRSAGTIKVGDIAVYRRCNRLFAHRTIAKGSKVGLDYIVTRPDRARFGNDGPSFDKDILGIVARIERKGRILSAMSIKYSLMKRFWLSIYIYVNDLGGYCWNRLAYLHINLQEYRFYRFLIRFLFINSKIEFSLQAPISLKPNSRFFRKLSLEELKASLQGEFALSKWMLTLKVNSKSAGYLSFFLKPGSCQFCGWWLYQAQLRDRYRGTNIEKKFFNQVDDVLKNLGIKDISLSILKNSGLERFFKNMGFKAVYVAKDIFLTDKNKTAVERAIMKKTIPE
ncbi:MAG: hypothetical protein COV73_04830 [Candidatus Omnitrophica bacterium CG11_big_fil_rev_8_21_14_0_20_43_6]|nr:MAG: hypothetical protein COV73_04830 [Candidatus Omnitrophica bacterium CG11_big_fil_rev_8_21_14_0_20_43_6]